MMMMMMMIGEEEEILDFKISAQDFKQADIYKKMHA